MSAAAEIAASVKIMNDAYLDGLVSRSDWLISIAAANEEITNAGTTWDAVNDEIERSRT